MREFFLLNNPITIEALLMVFLGESSFIFSHYLVPITTHHLKGSIFSVQVVQVGSSGFACGISAVHYPLSMAVSEISYWKLENGYSINVGLKSDPPIYFWHF